MFRFLMLVLAWVLLLAAPTGFAAQLIMLEQQGCHYCEQWDEEIGAVYDKTDEGKRAPLRRVDIHDKRPSDLPNLKKGRYTPTFVLYDKGREVGRIRGYPGEDFFWPLLGQLLEQLPDPSPDPLLEKTSQD